MADIESLFHDHAAGAFERQLRLGEILGTRAWQFDKDAGTLTFGKKGLFGKPIVLPIQILGTESEVTQTWRWSWANDASGLPEKLTETARALRSLGERDAIDELASADLPLEALSGHQIAMIASGVAGLASYYRCPYEGGAMFALFLDRELLPAVSHPVARALAVFPQAIDAIAFDDHRRPLRGLLRDLGFSFVDDTEAALAAVIPGKGDVHARFDAKGRLTELKGNARP